MKLRIIDFDIKLIEKAGELLAVNQASAFKNYDRNLLSHEQCCRIINEELNKDISTAIMVMDNEELIGFAISVINDDPSWGKSGWVNIGGWAVDSNYSDQISRIYQIIAERWIKSGIYQHYFLVYAENLKQINLFNELGFAKQQAYAVYDFSRHALKNTEKHNFRARKATIDDQPQISGFSRIIAEHQIQSPCFAAVPDSYLKELDKGFSELTEDNEADIYVIEDDRKIIGLQIFYEEENAHLFIPPNSIELVVSSVKEEYRGRGAGYQLTAFALQKQKENDYDYSVTDWRCANLLSSSFWQKIGFIPTAYRLFRSVDPLIKL